MSTAFTKMATVACSTKRALTTAGASSGYSNHLSGLLCIPIERMPREQYTGEELGQSLTLWMTFIESATALDIQEGHQLVVGTQLYYIKRVHPSTFGSTISYMLVMERAHTANG